MQSLPLIRPFYGKIGIAMLVVFGVLGFVLLTDSLIISLKFPLPNVLGAGALTNQPQDGFSYTDILPTLCGIGFLIGGLFVMLSRRPQEDEFMNALRLNALLWAVIVNSMLLIAAFALLYGLVFFQVMIFHLFTIPLIFTIRFHYLLFRVEKTASAL